MKDLTSIIQTFKLTSLDKDVLLSLLNTSTPLTVRNLNCKLQHRGENLYRSINKLASLGLIEKEGSKPAKYSARNFDNKVKTKLLQERSEVSKLISTFSTTELSSDIFDWDIKVLSSREEYKSYGLRMMKDVRRSLWFIASGAPQSKDFFKAHVDLAQRGINVKALFSSQQPQYQKTYANWIANGINVRITDKQGANIIIYDSNTLQIATKKSPQTKQKHGVVLTNPFVASLFKDYYNILWQESKEIGQ